MVKLGNNSKFFQVFIFIAASDQIDGLVHLSDLSWEGNTDEILSKYKKGDVIKTKILDHFYEISEELNSEFGFDFKNTNVTDRMNELSEEIIKLEKPVSLPDSEILLIQRKISGLFFLARTLGVKLQLSEFFVNYSKN